MHDPFPLKRPEALVPYVQKVADALSLQTLPLHFHEVMLAFVMYHSIHKYGAPAISRLLLPRTYNNFSARTKLNWDVHIVSFFQSTFICGLALWVNVADKERSEMTTEERVYGYTGASGLVQAFAGGYFLWDLIITLQNVSAFGIGMLFHAISALCVFSLGFRPFVNYYATSFILYELSSPFLNIHWFCDKLNMTGSTIQFINGICLLFTFFSCRLVWGTYNSIRVAYDVYQAYTAGTFHHADPEMRKLSANTTVGNAAFKHNVLQFAEGQHVPLWLAGAYLASNITLNSLNWFWFGKMIETLRKRFDPPIGTRRPEVKEPEHVPEAEKVLIEGIHVATPAAIDANGVDYMSASDPSVTLEKNKSGMHLEVSASEVRSRTSTRRKA